MKRTQLHSIALFLVLRQLMKNDVTIGVSGVKGAGKSTFMIQLFRYIFRNRKKLVEEAITIIERMRQTMTREIIYELPYEQEHEFLDLKKHIIYSRSEIKEKAKLLPKGSCMDINEGSRGFYGRNWNTKEQKELIISFWQIRYKKFIIGVEIQDFFTLDKDFRKMLDLWIFVPEKGIGMIFIKDRNPFVTTSGDEWHITDNTKIMKKLYKGPRSGIGKLVRSLRKSINFIGETKFKPLPPKLEDNFSKISEEMKATTDREGREGDVKVREDKWKGNTLIMLKNLRSQGMSYNDIAKFSGLNAAQISNMINSEKKPVLQVKPIITNNTHNEPSNYIPSNLVTKNGQESEEDKGTFKNK